MTDADLWLTFNHHFLPDEAGGYSTEPPKIYMARKTTFSRDALQRYLTDFLKTKSEFPQFFKRRNNGEKINDMFIAGIEHPSFFLDVKRNGTETFKDTLVAIWSELPLFQTMVNKEDYSTILKVSEKSTA